MNNRDLPLSRSLDHDHSSGLIIDDLLNSLTEWRSVQDIVRLSIKAVADSQKYQGSILKELQYLQSEFVLKSEISSTLAMKANLSDLSRAISETRASLDSKASYDEIRAFLDDRVTRSDLLHLLQGKVSVEEFRTANEFKVDVKEMHNEIQTLKMMIENLKDQTISSLQHCPTQRDFQVLQRQLEGKADIAEVNAALNEKATKTSVANALHKKANKADVDEIVAEKASVSSVNGLIAALENKVGIPSFNALAAEIEKKAEEAQVEKMLKFEISKKAEKEDAENLFASVSSLKKDFDIKLQQQSIMLANYISEIRSEIDMNKHSFFSNLEKKADFRDIEKLNSVVLKKADSEDLKYVASEHQEFMVSQQSSLKQELKKLETQFYEHLASLEKQSQGVERDHISFKDYVRSNTEKTKQEIDEVVGFFEKKKNEEIKAVRYDLEKIQKELEDVKANKTEDLKTKSELKSIKDEVELKYNMLTQKIIGLADETKEIIKKNEVEFNFLTGNLKSKNEEINDMQNSIEEFKSNSIKKQDWENQAHLLREEVEKMGKELMFKANVKDICTLLDIKANIDDVNRALEELHQEIDGKVSIEELSEKLKEQSCINDALCAENCAARWLWKTGGIKAGCIPWELQPLNTCPENFVWEKDKTTILTITPGLYLVAFGVFSKKKCTVQLLVNGEIVISDGNTSGKVLGKHSSGNVAGVTFSDYVSLPARARVSISFNGDPCEGFLGLKKL